MKETAEAPGRCLFSFLPGRFRTLLAEFLAVLLLVSPLPAAELTGPAQQLETTNARLIADDGRIAPGGSRWIGLELHLSPGWHTYWINPGDTGFPAKITSSPPEGATLGPIHWPLPVRFEEAGLANYGYADNVILPIPLSLAAGFAGGTLPIALHAEWLVCKDICLPEKADLTLVLSVDAAAPAEPPGRLAETLARVPRIAAEKARYHFDTQHLWVGLGSAAKSATAFLPATEGAAALAPAATVTHDGRGDFLVFPRGLSTTKDGFSFVAVPAEGPPVQYQATDDPALAYPAPGVSSALPVAGMDLPIALLLAFLGGILLNVMPCVLPVLSLKILALSRGQVTRREAAAEGLAYTAGILVSFALLAGGLLLLRQGGQAFGWGYQLQAPLFVLFLIVVIFAVGLSLSGVFALPVLFGQAHHRAGERDSLWGSALAGLLATFVATPCTAPFMAPAIGYALTLPAFHALLVFEALGAGLALPFLAIALLPRLRRLLPKPGRWMETLKRWLALPMYATALWLLSVLAAETGPLAFIAALLLLIWIAPHARWLSRATTSRARRIIGLRMIGGVALAVAVIAAVPPTPPPALTPANAFSQLRLDELRATGKPVFVDATANWCITCKVNEKLALGDVRVKAHFAERGITILIADWTRRDDAIGRYLATFGRSGVPTYVYYPSQGEPRLLPQILTPEGVVAATP